MSQNKEQSDDRENADDLQPCSDGGSCCPSGSDGGGKRWKIAVFVLIVVAAGAVLANSFIKKSDAGADQSQQAFASFQMDNKSETPCCPSEAEVAAESPVESKIETEAPPGADETENKNTPAKSALSLWGPDLDSLASLNNVATDTDAVFVFVAAGGPQNMQPVTGQIEAAVKKIKSNGVRVSAFRLKEAAPEYVQLAEQISVPCVLAMVKGGGMSTVSGEITEARLVQAFVMASRPTSGCGPAGCPPGSTTCPPQK
jgi:hypothetical protein